MVAVAYLRVSGASQVEGTGFDRQHDACTTFATSAGFTLAQTFREEAVSGTKDADGRPAFQAMIAAMLDNGPKIVLVESLDRLARQYDIQQQLATYIASKGLTLYSANTGEDITAALMGDPMRRAVVQIQGIFAELDKNLIIAKLRKGRERTKALHGRCEGQKPFGHYPDETATLVEIRALRAAGMIHQQIADTLATRGIPARSGRPWNRAVIARILGRDKVAHGLRSNCATPVSALIESRSDFQGYLHS